jgi:hypothetical protein
VIASGRNVVLMLPNAPAALGPEAIKSRYQNFFDNPGSKPTGADSLKLVVSCETGHMWKTCW